MQTHYDDRMPNPDNATPQRPIRIADEPWDDYGRIVGERERSADLKTYIDWRRTHPYVDLNTIPGEQVLDLFVRVRIAPTGERQAEVLVIPGNTGPAVDKLKTEIIKAIADHFNGTEKPPTKRARKAE
jgi:hypothetical protein